MQSLNSIVDDQLDAQAAFNLVLCTFALGDKETMKQAFTRLVEASCMSHAISHRLLVIAVFVVSIRHTHWKMAQEPR